MILTRKEILQFLNNFAELLQKRPDDPRLDAYSALFEGTDAKVRIPLWESAYCGEKNVLMSEVTFQVLSAYLDENICPEKTQPPDYIGYEAEFFCYLLRTGQAEKGLLFLETHFRPLAVCVLEAVIRADRDEFYTVWAQDALSRIRNLKGDIQALLQRKETGGEAGTETGTESGTESCTKSCNMEETDFIWHFRPVTQQEKMRLLSRQTILTSGRGNCGGKCRIQATVQGGCILDLKSEIRAGGPKPCVMGRGYRKTFLSPDRLRYPMVRTGERGEGRFRRISWEEALDLMAEKIKDITGRYGPGSRYVQYATGNSSVLRGDRIVRRLLALDGGYLGYYNSYSSACAEIAIPYTYGTDYVRSSLSTYRESKLLILWGYNPVVTMHNSLIYQLLMYHKKKGTPIIVIDPQYSDTAAVFATKYLPIIPGTDSALAAAMAYVLWEEKLCNQKFMDTFCLGFDPEHMPEGYGECESYRDYIYGVRDGIPKTPAWAAGITGLSEAEITELARTYGMAKPAGILAGLGPQRRAYGEQAVRSVMVLPCMTGNVGIPGGGTAAEGQLVQHAFPEMPMPENPYGRSIPVFLWTDAILRGTDMTTKKDHIRGGEGLDSDIRLIFNLAGNALVNQHSDVNRTAQILRDTEKCEFIVVSDLFMTPSARYADLLLPGTSLFECDSMAAPWSEGDYLLFGNQAIDPLFEGRDELDWLPELAGRMGIAGLTEGCGTRLQWLHLIYDRLREKETELPDFDAFRRAGGYQYRNKTQHVAFQEMIQNPEKNPFPTKSGKIEIFSSDLFEMGEEQEIPAIPKYIPEYDHIPSSDRKRFPLQLLGWHTKRRCHSIHDNNDWMEQVEPHRLWINPEDAASRGLCEDAYAEIWNDRGRVRMQAHLSNRIRRGVVCIPQGAWYTPDETGTDIRGCVNVLTTLEATPLAKGNPQHSCLVEVTAWKGDSHAQT